MEGSNPLTVSRFLCIPNFGRKSLADLLFAVDGFLRRCVEHPYENKEKCTSNNWRCLEKVLTPLLTAANELHGIKNLTDALDDGLLRLADRMGISTEIREIGLEQIIEGNRGPVSFVILRLKAEFEKFTKREISIVEKRILRFPPITLEELSLDFRVTRERVRQIQNRLNRKINRALGQEFDIIAAEMKGESEHIIRESELRTRVDRLFSSSLEPVAEGIKELFRWALIDKMGLTLDRGLYFNEQSMREFGDVQSSIYGGADDVGLLDEQKIVASLPNAEWKTYLPWIIDRLGLHNFHGTYALRDTARAQVKAALLAIGRPATRKEISAICGFEEGRLGTHLSSIPSIAKADKERWGLKEWMSEEYGGILREIIRRIEEDGGATTTERLLSELPYKFNVSASSVRACMQTPKFVVRDGFVSLASKSSVQLRDLEDVIDGRDDSGAPYWTFCVHARFFDGYSLTRIPPEFARALGCTPDVMERLQVTNVPGCRDLSMSWRLASTAGASLGYLAEPLTRLGLKAGQRARITIRGRFLIELDLDVGDGKPSKDNEAREILKRMMHRRKII